VHKISTGGLSKNSSQSLWVREAQVEKHCFRESSDRTNRLCKRNVFSYSSLQEKRLLYHLNSLRHWKPFWESLNAPVLIICEVKSGKWFSAAKNCAAIFISVWNFWHNLKWDFKTRTQRKKYNTNVWKHHKKLSTIMQAKTGKWKKQRFDKNIFLALIFEHWLMKLFLCGFHVAMAFQEMK